MLTNSMKDLHLKWIKTLGDFPHDMLNVRVLMEKEKRIEGKIFEERIFFLTRKMRWDEDWTSIELSTINVGKMFDHWMFEMDIQLIRMRSIVDQSNEKDLLPIDLYNHHDKWFSNVSLEKMWHSLDQYSSMKMNRSINEREREREWRFNCLHAMWDEWSKIE